MTKQNRKQLGFTLIEVLVVVSILLVLTSILIPRLRVINKERGLRETARITGSIFSQASQRAIADGVAGVVLKHNPNFADDTDYSFAVTNMSLLRAVPTFSGDQSPQANVGAYQSGTAGTVTIPYPLEQADLQIIKPGDSISFGQSSVKYTISTVTPDTAIPPTELDLALDIGFLPDPDEFVEDMLTEPGTAYTIHRLPRVLQSSEVELPPNYIVDMRFSGFTMLDSGFLPKTSSGPNNIPRPADASTGVPFRVTNVFEPSPRFVVPTGPTAGELVDFTTSDIGILFNEKGEIDRMVRLGSDSLGNTYLVNQLAVDSLRLLIAEIITEVDTTDPVDNPLNSETNLWVTVNRSTGNTNVGYNNALGDASAPTITYTNTAGGTSTTDTLANLDQLSSFYNDADLNQRLRFNAIVGEARGFSTAQTASQ